THEGGISTPLIAQWPARFKVSGVKHSPCHVVDIMATVLDAAGASYPTEYDGRAIQPTDGESFLPQLEGKDWDRQRPIFFEHEGNAAVRMGQFKLVRQFDRLWELYDMWADRTELNDLMGSHDPLTKLLIKEYEGWAQSAGVLDWGIALPRLQAAWQIEDIHG
ncbi:MAG: sulfatase/phosphatase domain-containing protein, partial [Chloroflexota bacterium]